MNKLFDLARENNIELEITEKEEINTNISILNDSIEKYESSDVTNYDVKAIIDGKVVRYNTENLDNVLDILKKHAKVIDTDIKYDFINDTSNKNKFELKHTKVSYKEILEDMLKLNTLKEKYKELVSINVCFDHTKTNIKFSNTNGVNKEDANEIFSYYGEFVLNINGENETSFVSISKTKLDEIDLHKVVEKYIKEAYDNFKAESVKTSKYNIIINPESMGKILRTFSNMFSKELIDKNLSLLTGKVNTQVFNEKINIVEDPTNEHLVGKRLFDNEGVTTYYKDIVVNGKFITPLYNIKSAKKDNKKSTGNSFGVRNMYIKPGNISEENLLLMLNNGIYIKDLEGLHAGVDTISGNISLQATGYLVEDGIKTKALKMIILSTDLLELLNNVVEVASNLEFYNPLCGSPSILFKDITIAGKC